MAAGRAEGDKAVDGVWFRTEQHPSDVLQSLARDLHLSVQDASFASHLDSLDPVRHLRQEFHYPKNKDMHGTDLTLVDGEEECAYLAGFGLGLLPRQASSLVQRELDKWSQLGQHGFLQGDMPWTYCDEVIDEGIADLIGAKKGEVCLMNGCSVNLHLMLVSFYRPTPQRHKIVCEAQAFPSDHYVFESQIRLHGFDPSTSLIGLEPRKGESTLRTEDVVCRLEREGDSVAVVCLPGVQYLTGQALHMAAITRAAQDKGCYVGWDVSHSIGNVEHALHDWGVDFAVWCANKYLCSGAGGIGGIFLHEKHHGNDYPKLLGWMGHDLSTRFIMDNKMDPCPGAYAYRVCSPSPLLCAVTEAYLQVMKKTSLAELRRKTRLLTGYLELLINQRYGPGKRDDVTITVITPRDPDERGAMLCFRVSVDSKRLLEELLRRGAECDRREPDVIRVAPVPLYCSFKDVHRFMELLEQALKAV